MNRHRAVGGIGSVGPCPKYSAFFICGLMFSLIFGLMCSIVSGRPATLYSEYRIGTPPDNRLENYLVTTWTMEQGLPQNSVLCMQQTSDSYIYFGTQSGLVRFDGVSFRVYNRWNSKGLKNDHILSLHQDRNGGLWVGTDGGGLSCFKDGNWTLYNQTDGGLADNTVRALCEDQSGHLWVGTNSGLHRLGNDKIERYSIDDGLTGLPITALAGGADGSLWIGTGSNGVCCLKDGKFRHLPIGKKFPGSEAAITSLHESDGGLYLWIGTENGLFYLLNRPGEKVQAAENDKSRGFAGSSIRALMMDRRNRLWVGTEGDGLFCRMNSNSFQTVQTAQGLPDFFVYSLLQDSEGNIWFGTYTSGLVRLKRTELDNVTVEDGLPENSIHTVLQDQQHNLWVGTARSGLCRIKGDKVVETVTVADGLTGNRIHSLCNDRDQTLWIGTSTGLNRKQGSSIRTFTTNEGLSANDVTVIFRDGFGALWVGTQNGLNRWSDANETFEIYKQSSGLTNLHIRTLTTDRKGNLLIGTRGGLFIMGKDSGKISPIRDDGLPLDYDVLSLNQDAQGRIWVGTNGGGLIRIKNGDPGRFVFFTTADGLPNNHIFSILPDQRGYFWFTSYKGIFRISSDQLNRSADLPQGSERPKLTVLAFDEKEGMGSRQCALEGQPAAWLKLGGFLFVPTVRGLVRMQPDKIAGAKDVPPVLIQSVIMDNRAMDVNIRTGVSVPPHTQVIEFYFTAVNFSAPEKVRLRYKLEGYDQRWKEVSRGHSALYLNLPAGNYRFWVEAGNANGAWKGTDYAFYISQPFFKQPWIYLLLFLLAATAIVILRRGRKRAADEGTGPARAITPDHDDSPPADAASVPETGETEPKEKYKTSALLPETVDTVLPKLTRLMEKEKIYLEADLSLKILAQKLGVHYNHLSRIINEQMGKNFNDYINSYRIEEAGKQLKNPALQRKTILEIAYDTGFYSKSVFNTAFKKITGMTPSEYRKARHQDKK